MEVADQCQGIDLRETKHITWEKSIFKAPIPTRHQVWDHYSGIRVISTVEAIKGRGIEHHISISAGFGDRYPWDWEIEKVRKDFDAMEFEHDDHSPYARSVVAHLWLPIEKDKRGECPCK